MAVFCEQNKGNDDDEEDFEDPPEVEACGNCPAILEPGRPTGRPTV